MYICVFELNIDGSPSFPATNVLGIGGNSNVRAGSNIPVTGFIGLDISDVEVDLEVLVHEIGHAVGVGTRWGNLRNGADYTGTNALNYWRSLGCTDRLPLQSATGGHWGVNCIENEVMKPSLRPGSGQTITELTVESLSDVGWSVNLGVAATPIINTTDCCTTANRRKLRDGKTTEKEQTYGRLVGDDFIPYGVPETTYMAAKQMVLKELRFNRKHYKPKVRDSGGAIYVGDLAMHALVRGDGGILHTLHFHLPDDDDDHHVDDVVFLGHKKLDVRTAGAPTP